MMNMQDIHQKAVVTNAGDSRLTIAKQFAALKTTLASLYTYQRLISSPDNKTQRKTSNKITINIECRRYVIQIPGTNGTVAFLLL